MTLKDKLAARIREEMGANPTDFFERLVADPKAISEDIALAIMDELALPDD